MKTKLNKFIIQFTVEGISVVGNLKNSYVIGLDQKGKELIEYIEKYNMLPKEIPESLLPLVETLQKKEFIETGNDNVLFEISLLTCHRSL